MNEVLSPYFGQGNARRTFSRIFQWRGVAQPDIDAVWQEIEACYTEPHRHYHSMQHIDEVVTVCLMLYNDMNTFDPLMLAAILHDLVYDTHAKDNEAQSAIKGLQIIGKITSGLEWAEMGAMISALILGTIDHKEPFHRDACVLYDADLWRLGTGDFKLHGTQIRLEYQWVPNDQFYKARRNFLLEMLERPYIYSLSGMQLAYEDIARENMSYAIEEIDRFYP